MACNSKFTYDIERKRAGTTSAFGMLGRRLWRRRKISLKVKMKVFNAVVLPVLLYGTTAWALTRAEKRRLGAFEMDILRTIKGVS